MLELDHKEVWAPKNWCFWTSVLRRFLRVLWTTITSNQSILKEISPEYSLEALMLKLKLQYFGYLMQRADSLEKILMLGKIEGRRRRWQQRIRSLDSIADSMNLSISNFQEIVKDREAWHVAVHGVIKSQTQLCNWTTKRTLDGGWGLKEIFFNLFFKCELQQTLRQETMCSFPLFLNS